MRDETKGISKCMALIDKIFWYTDTVIYVVMILVVLLQIFARVFLPTVPSWTEEVSRYLQVYLVAFGAGIAIKHDAFISVDTIFHFLSEKTSLILKIINCAISLILFVVFFKYAIELYVLGIPRSAVSIPSLMMNYVYFSMMLMSASCVFYLIRKMYTLFVQWKQEGESL